MNTKLDFAKRYIHHPSFDDREEAEKILAYTISEKDYDTRYSTSMREFGHPILTRDTTHKLFMKYNLCKKLMAEGHDFEQLRKETKETILNHNIRLIFSNLKKFKDKEELISIGYITIDKAVDRFDYTLGIAFNTYVGQAIYMNCIRELYNHKELELAPEFSQYQVPSHYEENEKFINEDSREMMNKFVNENVLKFLSEREREILERHYGLNGYDAETLESIGLSKSVSKQRIRQIKDRAIQRLRAHCAKYSNVLCI